MKWFPPPRLVSEDASNPTMRLHALLYQSQQIRKERGTKEKSKERISENIRIGKSKQGKLMVNSNTTAK